VYESDRKTKRKNERERERERERETDKNFHSQWQGDVNNNNVYTVCTSPTRPKTWKGVDNDNAPEFLISVYAKKDIKAGDELLMSYGDAFWVASS
jgi:SET domain-containing protein